MSYRVLCDEHVPESTVAELDNRGVPAVHVSREPGAGSTDRTVAAYARENGYVLLTNDDDFLDRSTFIDVHVLYYPDNSIAAHALAERVTDLVRWVPDPAALGRVTFLTDRTDG